MGKVDRETRYKIIAVQASVIGVIFSVVLLYWIWDAGHQAKAYDQRLNDVYTPLVHRAIGIYP